MRARGEKGDVAIRAAIAALEEDAKAALAIKPMSVMDKTITPPSGDRHDYMSQAPYWWPDPAKSDGKPYIRKDGERNPEISIRQGLDFMVPYAAGERKWTFDQITTFRASTIHRILRRGAVAWKEPKYKALAEKIGGGSPRLILTMP